MPSAEFFKVLSEITGARGDIERLRSSRDSYEAMHRGRLEALDEQLKFAEKRLTDALTKLGNLDEGEHCVT